MAFGETFFAPSSYGDALTPAELKAALREIHACGALATIHAEEVTPERITTWSPTTAFGSGRGTPGDCCGQEMQ